VSICQRLIPAVLPVQVNMIGTQGKPHCYWLWKSSGNPDTSC
jgi:hypothetical protein